MSSQAPAPAPAEEPKPKKRLWETILTATPILLTILATLMAGQSSGQMTKAQYFRAVAAQNQSKSGDQWAFFQAKRIRGTTLQMAILTLRAQFGEVPVRPEDLLKFAADLVAALLEASGKANAAAKASGEDEGLKKTASNLGKQVERAKVLEKEMKKAVQSAEKVQAFSFLNTRALPVQDDEKTTAPLPAILKDAEKVNPSLPQANLIVLLKRREVEGEDGKKKRVEIEDQKEWEKETKQVMKKISDANIREAIDKADKRAKRFEDLSGPREKAYRTIDGILQQQLKLSGQFQSEMSAFGVAPTAKKNDSALADQAEQARATNEKAKQVANSFAIAELDYNQRRYDREARYNQGSAILYELQVRKSALTSDGHIKSSEMFFYAMLAAQAGVTIATFALAVRQKSALWGLASTAGLAALAIGGYVMAQSLGMNINLPF